MLALAIRFSDRYAPSGGTVAAHQQVIRQKGSVWFAKLGRQVSSKTINRILNSDEARLLLIKSGTKECWWATFDDYRTTKPDDKCIPIYYKAYMNSFTCWFHVTSIETAEAKVVEHSSIASTGRKLDNALHCSAAPFL